ncbi:hypothetical protein [Mycobacterium bourgelatii]|uniref:hypothetical protein n=1 Tax=Mycobacterium bourgelatii TaxID=1273442 RepID=UPI0013CFD41C|nr:hypothetical protein [Mycobacterium bourgelatii]MCV6975764.1 hypothetical protein [Mycobacterium bourgelatii]
MTDPNTTIPWPLHAGLLMGVASPRSPPRLTGAVVVRAGVLTLGGAADWVIVTGGRVWVTVSGGAIVAVAVGIALG